MQKAIAFARRREGAREACACLLFAAVVFATGLGGLGCLVASTSDPSFDVKIPWLFGVGVALSALLVVELFVAFYLIVIAPSPPFRATPVQSNDQA